MQRFRRWLIALALSGPVLFWYVTQTATGDRNRMAGLTGDAAQGEHVFYASGCASCHAAKGAEGDAKLILSGGLAFPSDFGTFFAPNISPDPDHGIGGWSALDLANAMQHGVSPDRTHYYPAFPYVSYAHATDQDIADLWAFLQTLPSSQVRSLPHDVSFPFNVRRSLGGWKFLFAGRGWVVAPVDDPQLERGRYLVEGLGHCAECHTPRNLIGGLNRSQWMSGASTPDGKGKVPALAPDKLSWSAKDIAYYLETGFTPDFDSAGGEMVDVIANTSKLPPEDRAAIAAYIAALP